MKYAIRYFLEGGGYLSYGDTYWIHLGRSDVFEKSPVSKDLPNHTRCVKSCGNCYCDANSLTHDELMKLIQEILTAEGWFGILSVREVRDIDI